MSSIIEFPVHVPDENVFWYEESKKLYGAWLGLARREEYPGLGAFAPGKLGRWLSWCGVVELDDDPQDLFSQEKPRWRLAGSSICKLAGRELDGEEMFGNWERFERSMLRRMILRTLREGHPFVARLDLGMLPGEGSFGLEMLALPFADGGRTVALVFFRPSMDTVTLVPGLLERARMISLRTLDRPEQALRPVERQRESAQVLPLFVANGGRS